jgi:hypothetical protein
MRHGSNDSSAPTGRASGILRRWLSNTPRRRLLALALTSGALLVAEGNAAHSQVQVGGKPEAVHIEASDVTLREVLDALQANFNLGYRSDDLLDTRMTGTFDGPLRQVVARILGGYDFAMKITPQGIDVLILSQADGKTVAAAARALVKKSPARARTAAEANRHERGLVR